MNEAIKTSTGHKTSRSKLQRFRGVIIIAGLVILTLCFCSQTKVKKLMAKGIERVFIYIDEYTNKQDETVEKIPQLKGLAIKSCKVQNLQDYEYITKEKQDVYSGDLILINKQHTYHFPCESDLVRVNGGKNDAYKIVDKKIRLNKQMLHHFNQMMWTFARDTGKRDIVITSGYRDLEDQKEILREKICIYGRKEALAWAMQPGHSEHHSGYAADISIFTDQGNYIRYRGQDEYGWINQNCHKYGIIRRYSGEKKELTGVKDEEWHYRYVGVPHSYIITADKFCLEEYIEYLKQFTFDSKHLQIQCDQGKYEIYFVPAEGEITKVMIPIDKKYSISGNNEDGFIVTVKLK